MGPQVPQSTPARLILMNPCCQAGALDAACQGERPRCHTPVWRGSPSLQSHCDHGSRDGQDKHMSQTSEAPVDQPQRGPRRGQEDGRGRSVACGCGGRVISGGCWDVELDHQGAVVVDGRGGHPGAAGPMTRLGRCAECDRVAGSGPNGEGTAASVSGPPRREATSSTVEAMFRPPGKPGRHPGRWPAAALTARFSAAGRGTAPVQRRRWVEAGSIGGEGGGHS